jgi:hypothetical protein
MRFDAGMAKPNKGRCLALAKDFAQVSFLVAWVGIQSHHNPDDGDRDSSGNVGVYLQPIDAAVCP